MKKIEEKKEDNYKKIIMEKEIDRLNKKNNKIHLIKFNY